MIEKTTIPARETSTPLMKQYWEIKSAHPDKILFFRMGDFFELFFEDAVVAAPLVGLTLTSRNKKAQDETPMCGLPHHSIAGPINKLLAHGYKVALCDQIEDPKLAKGIVKRAVTRILTPGMVFDNETLDATESHFMACFEDNHLALVDPSTGESFYYRLKDSSIVQSLISVLPVAEFILSPENSSLGESIEFQGSRSFHDSIIIQGEEPSACSRLRSYIQSLGGSEALSVLKPFEIRELRQRLEVSPTSLRHLEVYETYKGESKGSLFRALQRTQTSTGARMLRQWLAFPLRNLSEIQSRLDYVSGWLSQTSQLKNLRKELSSIGDIERRLSRLVTPQSHARDLISLAQATQNSLEALNLAQGVWTRRLSDESFKILKEQSLRMLQTFKEDAPLSTRQGHMIHRGISPELDELIRWSEDSQAMLSEMEQREKEQTGINSLKIRYNNVFGYYIEVTHTHKDKIPSHYQRKQTLTNAERYCTDELVELEKKVLTAQSKRSDLEWSIYDQNRREALQMSQAYLTLAHEIAEIDVLSSLSWLALEQNYVRPQFNEEGALNLMGARHPVVEQELKGTFIPNNINLSSENCMLLTGPNMAGKSTLMRQVAVIAMMAQMGSFVPCKDANLPLFDALFTRIGASDHLTEGLSTFMVEMTETAEILRNCTRNSLVILDEVGRGTSTFDGLSLAQSILEYLITEKKSLTFFATHYHELTELEFHFKNLTNYHMSVSESDQKVQFLHTLIKGPALKSYGIYVSELAGLPPGVTRRAKSLLKKIEAEKFKVNTQLSFFDYIPETMALNSVPEDKDKIQNLECKQNLDRDVLAVVEKIKSLSVDSLTPLKAFNHLIEWQEELNAIKNH